MSGSSLDHSPIPLTVHENGHSDHIVHTSGGGRCGSMKKVEEKVEANQEEVEANQEEVEEL